MGNEKRMALRGTFALFGEVLWTGILVTMLGLGVITFPAALTAGMGHMRRYLRAESSTTLDALTDFRRAMPGALVLGTASSVAVALLLIDIDVARSGYLPGSGLMLAVGLAGLVFIGWLLLQSAAWRHQAQNWREAMRFALHSARGNFGEHSLLLAGSFLVAILTWQLLPLFVPAIGCLTFGTVVLSLRHTADPARRH